MAYLWARTVTCKSCRATVPLLKTRWLCKKDNKRVVLTMTPNPERTGVIFGIQDDVPRSAGSAAQRREHDKWLGAGTMSRSGATCPCCNTIMTMEDIRLEGQAGRLGTTMTAVVVDGPNGKEYRLPTDKENDLAGETEDTAATVFTDVPLDCQRNQCRKEPVEQEVARLSRSFLYGLTKWADLFAPRQLLTLGTFVKHTRHLRHYSEFRLSYRLVRSSTAELAVGIDKLADRQSALCRWDVGFSKVNSTFTRFALPILWDYPEGIRCQTPLATTYPVLNGLRRLFNMPLLLARHHRLLP